MVKCNREEGASTEDIIVPQSSSSTYGFRLQDDKLEHDTATSVSAYSTYKQRIDSMFDETRSQMSSYGLEKIRPVLGSSDDEEGRQRKINNTVQARIEKMFAEMAQHSGDNAFRRKLSNNSTPSPVLQEHLTSINSFPVDYLGSVPLVDKVTSLRGLQEPLKNLYFAYRRAMETKRQQSEDGGLWMQGTLEINGSGLKVRQRGKDRGELEQLNPFAIIAVWAAVKFVYREVGGNGKTKRMEYAFLPLIADPDAIDKGTLFRQLSPSDEKTIRSMVPNNGTSALLNQHSSMFAVVMRKMGVSRQLECHGFVCACSEDAIVIAANLYQALMNNMQSKSDKETRDRPVSIRSGDEGTGKVSVIRAKLEKASKGDKDDPKRTTVAKIPPPVPIRPPRRNKKSSASSASENDEDVAVEKLTDKKVSPSHNKESGQRPSEGYVRNVRRTVSDRGAYMSITENMEGSGDILTKVAIPRSRSFLNAAGPHTRYGCRKQATNMASNDRGSIGTGSSPLGFNELFTEFRIQEGLNSMDDILDAIIDAEGMSFNDLKPIYKEFLLKLAVTLTKDELYQRSKNIMRRQRKKQVGRRGSSCLKRKKTFVTSVGAGVGLKRVFRRSVNKLKPAKSRLNNFEFTSVLFPATSGSLRGSKKLDKKLFSVGGLSSSTSSASSYTVRSFKAGNAYSKVPQQQGNTQESNVTRRRSSHRASEPAKPQLQTSTSEDSDFFSMARGAGVVSGSRKGTGPNRSSSGYFSCSECSYDSESCTCTSADKCYCSLVEKRRQQQQHSSCGCDTDSCIESDKCYCHGRHKHCSKEKHRSVFEQLKQRGFIASQSTLSRAASPTTAWKHHESQLTSRSKRLPTSRSLELLDQPQWSGATRRMDVYEALPPRRRHSSYQNKFGSFGSNHRRSYSSDNLALDYDLFTTSSKSEEEDKKPNLPPPQRKVLVVSARDPRGRLIYMGASCRSDGNKGKHSQTSCPRQRRIVGGACEALSVKKSAEIAAIFSDVKLDQRAGRNPDVFYNTLEQSNDYFLTSKTRGKSQMGSSLENSLGYLP